MDVSCTLSLLLLLSLSADVGESVADEEAVPVVVARWDSSRASSSRCAAISSGSFKSTALAVEKNDNGTSADPADDYYQVAVSQSHTWTDFNGTVGSDSNWQVYAVKADGTVDWEKTIWTESIADFEGFFGQDLNGDSVSGVNAENLEFAPLDTQGYRLKKDNDGLLHIVDNAGDNRISIKDQDGGYPSFDH